MRTLTLAFVFIFGLLSLAPHLQGAQFFKLGQVIEHYQVHQSSNEHFQSFIDFLSDHYFKNRETHSNEQELPFKSVVSGPVVIAHQKIEVKPITIIWPTDFQNKPIIHPQMTYARTRISTIWNPPQRS
jgi:hypothetical protein